MAENHVLEFRNNDLVPLLFGERNSHIAHLERKLGISIADRGNQLTLSGNKEAVSKAEKVLNSLWDMLNKNQDVGTAEIDAALRFLDNKSSNGKNGHKMNDEKFAIHTKKKTIGPRSPNQALYIKAIQENSMVFGLGPAGTGKTYLAVSVAVSMYLSGEVERLIFCRPAVEAGERLGFLPGDMKEKVDPYLRPIYDALQDMMPWDLIVKKMEIGEIEVAPLAFMRGRTLSNAFVILDEAQNTTATQMKMFLTRMGESSRMVITGDITQTDLPVGIKSGLRDAVEILGDIPEIQFINFTKEDVIRHPLVGKIVNAYDKKK
ncbi:MAG: PhoH family protein [Alphaproteobacteria bacterium]